MSTPRRRPTGGIRRPQVAGRPRTRSDAETEEETGTGGLALDERSGDDPDPATEQAHPVAAPVRTAGAPDADGTDGDAPRARRRLPLPPAPSGRNGTTVLAVLTVLLLGAAAFFGFQWATTEFGGSAGNTALSDVGTTAAVSEQVGAAVTKVYSFDYARLQQAEDDARAVITPQFQPEFDRIFGSVKDLAPQQKAVVTATIPKSAVASIDGDRATVYVFVNQVIRRQADTGTPQEGAAAARLRVDAERVDGTWKIAAMTPA
ncbi:hypothetical protein [Pseudonocardia spirodelae]|uniref:Mce-associated membrane protein n=1 Tax=Pseudonocardia spirodelae TaxID=3133431 RepID=A0ABU8T8F3_9PSEU